MKEIEAMHWQYFLTCHNFHLPKFELALQGCYISLPETLIKGLRKLLITCQRHPTGIAVGSLLLFFAHCGRDCSLPVSHWGQGAASLGGLHGNEPATCTLHPVTPAGVWEPSKLERDQ